MTVQTVKDVADGAMLGGKYRIRRVLGQGGMGVVVEAIHVELDDRVAIKFLTPRALAEPDAIQRFVREAKAAVRLRSEHIARVRDVGVLPGGDPYIVMEYLDGVELRQLLSGPRLAPSALVDLVLQACEGLAEAHSIGIVHRDIKPSNLFVVTQVDGTPHIKVLDFGVSKVPLDDLNLTGTNSWMGTPAYMSPEQMRSTKNVDPRSDLWSLAVVLYEGLEGRVPFPGDSLADLCINVTTMPPQPLTERTPPALAPIVMKGLSKQPADRYDSAAAFAEALAPFAETPSHAEMIVRRTRRMFDRRATPPSGVPALERPSSSLRVVPSASTEHLATPSPRTEHLGDFVPPPIARPAASPSAQPSQAAPSSMARRVDAAIGANEANGELEDARGDAADDPDPSGPLDSGDHDARAVDDGEVDPAASIELGEVEVAGRRGILGILAGVAAVALILAVVLFVVRNDVDRESRDAGVDPDRAAPGSQVRSEVATPDASVGSIADGVAVTPDARNARPDPHAGRDTPGARHPTPARPDPRATPGARPERPRTTPDAAIRVPVDAGVAPADAAPVVTPDADPMGRRT